MLFLRTPQGIHEHIDTPLPFLILSPANEKI